MQFLLLKKGSKNRLENEDKNDPFFSAKMTHKRAKICTKKSIDPKNRSSPFFRSFDVLGSVETRNARLHLLALRGLTACRRVSRRRVSRKCH